MSDPAAATATRQPPAPSVAAGDRMGPPDDIAAASRFALPAAWLVAFITAWLALDQLLLWRFLGLSTPLLAAGVALSVLVVWRIIVAGGLTAHIPLRRVALCIAFALALMALAGEGRWFYANIDWQVRDAVLRDMALHPWPFVYVTGTDQIDLLRAPIGMFLAPALAHKAWGPAAGDAALWLQNGLLIGTMLALGSQLFATPRARWIAFATITLFSGLDLIGTLAFHGHMRDHLEFWFETLQFSSHITQAFWVPQHALAGWLAALLFLLWQQGRMRLWVLLAIVPLTALWSPLGLIGGMPFVIWAGIETLRRRALTVADIGWPLLTVALASPGLLYLSAAGDGVGIRAYPVQLLAWAIFVTLELLVWAVPLLLMRRESRFGRAPLIIATLWLLACPFIQIGWSLDFMMRTAIPSLLVIAIYASDALADAPSRWLRAWLALVLIIGSATGLSEVRRGLTQPPTPHGQCSFFGAWDVSFARYRKDSYIAPIDRVPSIIRPEAPARVVVNDPSPCWQGTWMRPDGV